MIKKKMIKRHFFSIVKSPRIYRFGRPTAIISQIEYSLRAQTMWRQAFPEDNRVRVAPRRFGRMEANFAPMVGPLPALGVFTFPEGRAVGRGGWAFTAKGEIISETTWHGSDLSMTSLPISFGPAKRLSGTCISLVSEFAAANYGHYLLDCLSRVGLVEKAGFRLDDIDFFYLYAPPSTSARLMLDRLHIDERRCVWANDVDEVIADRLIVTTFPGTKRNYSRVVPRTLGRAFHERAPRTACLYLPRRGTRSIVNSAEIEAISMELGLELYDFTKCDDEFAYFSEAKLVVAPHGAAMTNIVACRPGAQVLELLPSDHIYPYYYTLAEAGDLRYSYLVGLSESHRPPGTRGPSEANFHVDPEEYRLALLALLAERTKEEVDRG